jgi:ferredoxin
MSTAPSHLLICSCEKTMPLDTQAIGRGCAAGITQANQLCGLELERFKEALADGAPITVACTQEAPLFREVAENFPQAELTFVNIRETGGWSNDAAAAGPKAAALIAAAGEEMPPISLVTLESSGVVLIYGRDEIAIEAAQRLADRLDITVVLTKPGDVTPRRTNEFPVLKGTVRNASGYLGRFELAIDDYALPLPSSRARPRHEISALRRAVETSDSIISALGFGAGLVRIIETDDPDQLRVMLDAAPAGVATQKPAGFVPRGAKRSVLETTFRELHLAAPAPVDTVPLTQGAPFGGVKLDVEGCTLCHACVTACPTAALSDNPDRAMLRFTESLCVQCGLCESTCPEKVITLEPRLDFKAWNAPLQVLKEEEPFHCIACGKPFGTKSSIDRVLAKLGEKHWMFQGANAKRIDVIKMCADCRVEAVVNEGFDPHAAAQRPPVMTTEDYLRARDANKDDPLGS